jgi:hypothetical protein
VRASFKQDIILSAVKTNYSVTGQYMDSEAPRMLTLRMLQGTWASFNDPNAILLSRKQRGRYLAIRHHFIGYYPQ